MLRGEGLHIALFRLSDDVPVGLIQGAMYSAKSNGNIVTLFQLTQFGEFTMRLYIGYTTHEC